MIALLSRLLTGPAPRIAPWYLRLKHWFGLCDLCQHGGWIWLPLTGLPEHHAPRSWRRLISR